MTNSFHYGNKDYNVNQICKLIKLKAIGHYYFYVCYSKSYNLGS